MLRKPGDPLRHTHHQQAQVVLRRFFAARNFEDVAGEIVIAHQLLQVSRLFLADLFDFPVEFFFIFHVAPLSPVPINVCARLGG